MRIRQLFDQETWTYTYLVFDPASGEAALIDPVREQLARDTKLVRELGLKLKYVLETHVHADHVTAASGLREALDAKSVVSAHGGAGCADIHVDQGDVLKLGASGIEVRATPGHTQGCITYVLRDGEDTVAFTGDALFVRGSGRTDFQGGDARTLYRSVHEKIFTLPDDTVIYPGHDYRGHTLSTVGEEKRFNPRLNLDVSEDEFVEIMKNLKLANPRFMDVAVPANLACGSAA